MPNTSLNAWHKLKLDDLVYAYRKAKADCFFERSTFAAEKFVTYERNLATNLAQLLTDLQSGRIADLMLDNIGSPQFAPKKLSIRERDEPQKKTAAAHCFFSDPERAFEQMTSTYVVQPEFRLVGDFSVTMHVLSALWVNLVGHRFDAILPDSAYGSRLRRYTTHSRSGTTSSSGKYHVESLGSFEPYFGPYRKWRSRGLEAMRRELEANRAVIAATFDFSSYFHRIDPASSRILAS